MKPNKTTSKRRRGRPLLTFIIFLIFIAGGYALYKTYESTTAEDYGPVNTPVPIVAVTQVLPPEERKLQEIRDRIEKSAEFRTEMDAIFETKLESYALVEYNEMVIAEANAVQEKINANRLRQTELGL